MGMMKNNPVVNQFGALSYNVTNSGNSEQAGMRCMAYYSSQDEAVNSPHHSTYAKIGNNIHFYCGNTSPKWSNAATLTAKRHEKSIPTNVLLIFLRMTWVRAEKFSLSFWTIQGFETQILSLLPWKHHADSHSGQTWLVVLHSSAVPDPASQENNLKVTLFTTNWHVGTSFPTRFVLICRIQQV